MKSIVLIVATMAAAGMASAPLAAFQTPPAQTTVPKPTPFPGSGTKPSPTPTPTPSQATAPPVGAAADLGAVDPRLAGIAAYPGAEFLATYDAGSSQKVFVFGTNDTYEAAVAFYKLQFKKSGEEIARQPRIQQFELGAFNSGTMSQRPSVIVKDYTVPDPDGYLHVSGTTQKRFKTLIQIIPVTR